MTVIDNVVAVWTDASGVPDRIVWQGERYRVTDDPTPLGDELGFVTHPLPVDGWRFQGTTDTGRSRVFDVLFSSARHEWRVVRTYE